MMLKSCYQSLLPEAGCDEAGRGCLAGPVFAAAVILPTDYIHPLLNDSKQLDAKQREKLRIEIERDAIAWSVQSADASEIDRINILNASFLAVHRSLNALTICPGFILMDGNRFPHYKNIPHKCIIKGDSLFLAIAAASILAKTYRDDFMRGIHNEHPAYLWNQNKGYPTIGHRTAIVKNGLTQYHRKSFRLTDPQLKLNFECDQG
jgi:ribonuclease HII